MSDNSVILRNCFDILDKGNTFSLDTDTLKKFLSQDLDIKLDDYSIHLQNILVYMLVIYIKKWPDWKSLNTDVENQYNSFKDYLKFKLNNLISTDYNTAMSEIKDEDTKKIRFSPYKIVIECTAHMANTMVFSKVTDNGDVLLTQHFGNRWEQINTNQLINWPFIEVQYVSKELIFTRRQAIEYIRYLNILSCNNSIKQDTNIERAEKIDGNKRYCFSLKFINAYLQEYLKVLKLLTNLDKEKYEEIQSLLHNFIQDIKDLKENFTIATNTRILFKYDGCPSYIRNKKLLKNNEKNIDPRIGFCEILIPKIELLLEKFSVNQEDNKLSVEFDYTNNLRKLIKSGIDITSTHLPIVIYKCTFCNLEYNKNTSKKDILDHLSTAHKIEHPVRCLKCKRQFDVTILSSNRWKHFCM